MNFMDAQTLSSAIQGGLSVVGFIALSFWLMNWAKGLHERSKELGDIDKDIRVALKDSIAAQKELHVIERKKLELQLENLTGEIGKKHADLEAEKRILQAAIKALGAADEIAQKLFSEIDREYEGSQKHFLRLMELLDSNGMISKETFYYLDAQPSLAIDATKEQELAWLLTEMISAETRIVAWSESAIVLGPAAVGYAIRNPDCSEQEIASELANTIRSLKK